jgi:RNA polymerase sigma factor (sigma-70 family)
VLSDADVRREAAAIWRIESAKLIAVLVRLVRDVALAEEIAQDAFVDALVRWEQAGIPENPGGWLMTAARHLAIDVLRRARRFEKKRDELAGEVESVAPAEEAIDAVGDDLLRLMFVACHPVLSRESRVALTLRLLGGLSTEEIARAFLVGEPTIAQRITRAKRTLAEKNVAFELPSTEALDARLESVLEVIYLVFNEGYTATAGDDWMRPALCQDALRLGRVLAELVPAESEVHALLALMEIQASRERARRGANGAAVLLPDQDRTLWDWVLIRRGLDGLTRAEELVRERRGPYLLQAAIAACHARAKAAAETDWAKIAALYAALAAIAPSPIVELNRAVAVSMVFGAEEGLKIVDRIAEEPSLREYPFLPSVRADLLAKLGRFAEARREIQRAVALTENRRERDALLARAASYGSSSDPS